MRAKYRVLLAGSVVLATACGGGSGDDGASSNGVDSRGDNFCDVYQEVERVGAASRAAGDAAGGSPTAAEFDGVVNVYEDFYQDLPVTIARLRTTAPDEIADAVDVVADTVEDLFDLAASPQELRDAFAAKERGDVAPWSSLAARVQDGTAAIESPERRAADARVTTWADQNC